jgi:hypothetical protein
MYLGQSLKEYVSDKDSAKEHQTIGRCQAKKFMFKYISDKV